jgi:hypothetical protein
MKSLKLLPVTQAVAAATAIAFTLGAVPLISSAATIAGPIVIDIPGTPDNGLACHTGYTPSFVGGTTFKCSKQVVLNVVLECLDPVRPNYVIRAINGAASDGRDVCAKNGVVITSTGSLNGLVEGRDYVFAAVNPATITDRTGKKDHDEAAALGLADNQVDTLAAPAVVKINGGAGSKDNADVTLTHYIFATPSLGFGPFGAR